MIIADAIKKTDAQKPEDVMKGLSQVKNFQATTGLITISPDKHQPVGLSMVMYKIEQGKYIDLGRFVPEKHKK
jgi:branched-chain amino acid transport system substrate-binding protein